MSGPLCLRVIVLDVISATPPESVRRRSENVKLFQPMTTFRKNSIHTVSITALQPDGCGWGTLGGRRLIVDGALPGETVEVSLIKLTGTVIVGKLLRVISPSPDRVAPCCPVFKRCGGCHLQHLHYDAQLRFKTELVATTFKKDAHLQAVPIHPTSGMATPRHYRNKAQYPVQERNGKLKMGFYARRSHEIVEHSCCAVQAEVIEKGIAEVRKFLSRHNISVYDEAQHYGLVRHVLVRVGIRSGEVMLVLVINGNTFPHAEQLITQVTSAIPQVRSILLNRNQARTNVIAGPTNEVLYGESTICDVLGGLHFQIAPHVFYQTNPAQTEVLYQYALNYAGLTGKETVFDVYCGIGTIALFLAAQAKRIYGVDVVEAAIDNARKNAVRNSVRNVVFRVGRADSVIHDLNQQGIRADVVVLDPPRKGCDAKVLDTLIAMRPARIIYVSCHPKSLARDAARLVQHGWRIVEVQPIDMFPHTTHVECVAQLLLNKQW